MWCSTGRLTSPVPERPRRPDETYLDPAELADTYRHLIEQDAVGTQPFEVHVTNGPQETEFI